MLRHRTYHDTLKLSAVNIVTGGSNSSPSSSESGANRHSLDGALYDNRRVKTEIPDQYAYEPFHRTRASLKRRALSRLPAKASANLSLSFGAGWYQREQSGTDWLRWSSGSGRIRAYAPQPTTLQAICEMASLKRPNRVDVIVNAKRIASWSTTGEKFEFRPLPRLEIKLQCGENEIRFLSHQRPSRTHAAPRKLAFAVKNLVFLDEHGHSCCIDH